MSLKDLEYDSEQMVGAARRKSKYPRKILRVVLDDGSCKLQPQLTPDDIKIKDEDWSYYNNYGNNDYQEFDEPITEVIPSTGNYTALPSHLQQHPYENYPNENYTNENYSSENYPNEKYSGENYSSEKYPSEKYPIDKYSSENYSSEKYPNEKYPSEKYSTEKYPTEQYPTEKYPTEKYSSEKYSSEKYPSEKYPNEKYTSENYSHSYNNSHHATNILSTHHPTNELPPTQYMSEDYAGRHHIKNNEQKDHPLKGLSDLRLNDARHDAENRYYDTSQKNDTSTPYMYLNDKPRDMKHIENTSSLLNNRLRATNNNDIKPKDNTRPHKHQHPEPTPDFPYQCDTCDMLFKTIDLLTDHQTTVHHNNRQFACRYCSKRFNDKYNMRKHVLIHVGEKRHRCQFCDKAFLRKDHLRSHLQTHYNRKFGCKVCGKSFRTLDMYQRHAKTHKTSPSLSMANDTPNPDNPYPDLVNLAKLENPIPLTNGSNNRGTVGVKEDSNDSTTNIDNGDSLHISNVTSQYGKDLSPGMTKLESFPVTILDEDFNEFWKNSPSMSENDLSSTNSPVSGDHNHSFVNGDSPKTEGFSCHICNSSFKTDLSLQLHAQKCSGELRNWQCIKCNIIFDEAKTLKQHYEKVHSVEEPIPSPSRWRCKTCNINYPNSKELSRHYAQAHKDAQIFPCSECPKTFTVWHNLKKHMLIHLGDKKHKCTVCEKGFVRKDHLNSHMKVHLGDGSKFTCPICCKVFRLKQMYLKHMNLHGLEQAYDDGGKE